MENKKNNGLISMYKSVKVMSIEECYREKLKNLKNNNLNKQPLAQISNFLQTQEPAPN